MIFTFIPDGHKYFLGNLEIPALSRILELIDDNKDFYTVESQERGQNLHKMVELHELDNLNYKSLTDDMQNYLDQWEKVKKYFGIKKFNLIEVPLYCSSLVYGTTPDYYVHDAGIILDAKFGTVANHKIWALQTAGQENAIREKFKISKSKKLSRFAVRIEQNKFHPFPYKDHKDFNVLQALVIAYKYKNGLL